MSKQLLNFLRKPPITIYRKPYSKSTTNLSSISEILSKHPTETACKPKLTNDNYIRFIKHDTEIRHYQYDDIL